MDEKTSIAAVDEAHFQAEVLGLGQSVLVAFWAPWSQACQVLRPVMEELIAIAVPDLKVLKVNVDDNPDLGFWYEIQSIPTLIYFKDGKVRFRIVGTVSKEAILGKLKAVDTTQ